MPGSEWTNDEPGNNRDHSPDLNGPVHAPSSPYPPVVNFDQAHAQTPEQAMAHDQQTPDQDEPEGAETPARTRKPSGTPLKFLALLSKFPIPSRASHRPTAVKKNVDESESEPGEGEPAPARRRAPAKPSLLHLSRETRVGLAALISFAVLVTALVVKKKWNSSTPVAAISNPDDPDHKKDESKKEEPKKDESKKEEPKKEEPKPETKPVDESHLPETPPTAPNVTPVLAGGSAPKQPEAPPKSETELPSLPTVPEAPATAALPEMPPSTNTELPPVVPAAATQAPAATTPAVESTLPPPATAPNPASPSSPATEPPVIPAEPKAGLPEINPAPPGPPAEVKPAIPPTNPVIAEPPANPAVTLNPSPAAPTPIPTPTAPVPSVNTPPLDPVPPSSAASTPAPVEPAGMTTSMAGGGMPTAATSTAAALGAGWVVIQSGGRRVPGSSAIVSTPSDSEIGQPVSTRIADGPRPSDNLADEDQFEPVIHKVKPGENFWTISKLYYKSGRYYKALHAANAKQVPDITRLYVGTRLIIPPPEKLDRTLIERETAASSVTRTTKKADPADLADLAPPIRSRTPRPDPEAAEPIKRPTYKVKPYDTLRKIARETLNDSSRDKEIFDLNRDVLEDPKDTLPAGTTLVLPEDAVVSRSPR